jgi:hypothetical protein
MSLAAAMATYMDDVDGRKREVKKKKKQLQQQRRMGSCSDMVANFLYL